jgi:hypothetical protein
MIIARKVHADEIYIFGDILTNNSYFAYVLAATMIIQVQNKILLLLVFDYRIWRKSI